jgi:threonine/homoserine/homoserine lactone efflux protein
LLEEFAGINVAGLGSGFFLEDGLAFITTGAIWCFILAVFASAIFGKLKNNQKTSRYINKICGIALVGLGLKVAFMEKK